MRIRLLIASTLALAAFATGALTAQAAAPPQWWVTQALCIHGHESGDWHATTDWRGNPSTFRGGMQIDVRTWVTYAPVGFPLDPALATAGQQLTVAYLIWAANGHRFAGQWTGAAVVCGVA